MQRQIYRRVLAALAASVAVSACDKATAAPTTQANQAASPQNGYTVSANSANSGHTITFNSNGSFASSSPCVFSPDGLTLSCVNVTVQDGGSPSAQTTMLFYDAYTCTWDPNIYWFTCVDTDVGAGIIPNSDFSGGGGLMRLRTNTQADPSLFIYVGSGGLIDLAFRKTNLFSSSGQSTSDNSFGTFTAKQNEQSTLTSALTSGSMLGTTLLDASSSVMGTEHGNTIYHINH
ncbi:MAG TPA: hypothetical protein VF722_11195 [Gemmatimonadaceae bacterium]|jgi:hypothetical protein